jgi:REP element-mobilizing transposase RayT
MFEVRKRSRLPHWNSTAPVFVTFNLYDAMPREYVEKLEAERRMRITELERLKGKATPAELHAIEAMIQERVEECLDSGVGGCFMNDARVAEIVAGTVTHFDSERYELYAWTVMPNHVHAVFWTEERLDSVLHSWKSYSAKKSNAVLARQGKFWQDDYYDRTIRNQNHFEQTVKYVVQNPQSAGLSDWPWVRFYPERF